MSFCHSVGPEKVGCIGSLVLRIGVATKNLFCTGPKGFMNLCVMWGG